MQEIVAFFSILGPLLGIFTYFQWRVQQRTLKLDLMTKVHERYSKLYKTLASLEGHETTYANLQGDEKEAISAYINLCAEQFHWRHSERLIDDAVWKVWAAAIQEKLRTPAIREA
jgi:hypothetical protein